VVDVGRDAAGSFPKAEDDRLMAQSLELFRSAPRYLTARAIGAKAPGLVAGPLAPLRLVSLKDPHPPGEGWARVKPILSGICGSDLATLSGSSSFYFSPLVSLPFVPGHEVVGQLMDDVDGHRAGQRVVLSRTTPATTAPQGTPAAATGSRWVSCALGFRPGIAETPAAAGAG
jgi:Alcohol dehydrogenase GroES-like domain